MPVLEIDGKLIGSSLTCGRVAAKITGKSGFKRQALNVLFLLCEDNYVLAIDRRISLLLEVCFPL